MRPTLGQVVVFVVGGGDLRVDPADVGEELGVGLVLVERCGWSVFSVVNSTLRRRERRMGTYNETAIVSQLIESSACQSLKSPCQSPRLATPSPSTISLP